MYLFLVFLVIFCFTFLLGAFLNLLLGTYSKENWLMTTLISLAVATFSLAL
ncbi:hypothetical protein [Fictibacillus macauensis]|uniref:hypothetical protein n=1 Tax=Fictibacillus macauensis TaxID=245160 RepID=UPI0002F7D3AB|nr:hypothetical protein [Fictibacillus macauensis]